jgi:hypothetical protein
MLEDYAQRAPAPPFIADDLLQTFDGYSRTANALAAFADLSRASHRIVASSAAGGGRPRLSRGDYLRMRPRRVSGLTTTRRIGTAAWVDRAAWCRDGGRLVRTIGPMARGPSVSSGPRDHLITRSRSSLISKRLIKLVGATGIEPVTPTRVKGEELAPDQIASRPVSNWDLSATSTYVVEYQQEIGIPVGS